MTHHLRFQTMVLPSVHWPELERRALAVEALGFDMLGLADHFVDWSSPALELGPGHTRQDHGLKA